MKLKYLLLSIVLFIGNLSYGQYIPFDNLCATCSPNSSLFANQSNLAFGIEPSFAIITQGVAVNLPLTYMMPLQFEVGPPISPIATTADVYFIDLISIDWGGLSGLSATPDAFHYVPSTNRFGCINICGTTNDAPGSYTVNVKVYAEGGAAGQTGGDTAFVTFDVLVLPPGNPYFSTTPPESCQDTSTISVVANLSTFENLYDLDVYPTEYVWTLPDGSIQTGATPPSFDIYGAGEHVVTLTAYTYQYTITAVNVTGVNGNWWAGLFDDGALLGGSDPDLSFNISNGSNSTSGSEITNNFTPSWNISPYFSLTTQAVGITFTEHDLIGSDDGGSATFTVNGIGSYNFSTTGNNVEGNITIGRELINTIITKDTIIINPAVQITNLTGSSFMCQGDSILLSASATFSDFEWYNEDGILIDTLQNIYIYDAGSYSVKARATPTALCLSPSEIYEISIYPISTPSISQTANGLEIDNPDGYDVQWFSNGVPIPGATSDVLTDLSSGNPFTVSFTNANGCMATSVPVDVCIGGYATAPNGTDMDGDIAKTFEAVGFTYDSQTEIAWSVTPVADGMITSIADVDNIADGQVYLGDGNEIDLLLNCSTLGSGDYYLTPFLIEKADLPEFPYPYSDTTCIPTMDLGIEIDCDNQDWAIAFVDITSPEGNVIDAFSLSPFPITPPVGPDLICAIGGNIPDINLFQMDPNSNPNGIWKIAVKNSGTGNMYIKIPQFEVSLLAGTCSDITDDMVFTYGPYEFTIGPDETQSISITVPPIPDDFPTIANTCSAFGTPVELQVTNCVNSIEDLINADNINLFPNPNNGKFTLDFDVYEQNDITISIVDVTGRMILNSSYNNIRTRFSRTFDLKNNLNTGFYIMNIQVGNYSTQKKFIVK